MTSGLESSLPTPLASDAVIKKSTAKFGDRCPKNRPLVGTPAPRLTAKGSPALVDPLPPDPMTGGCGKADPVVTLLVPTVESPATAVRPCVVVPAKPHCVPISCAKQRHAHTT